MGNRSSTTEDDNGNSYSNTAPLLSRDNPGSPRSTNPFDDDSDPEEVEAPRRQPGRTVTASRSHAEAEEEEEEEPLLGQGRPSYTEEEAEEEQSGWAKAWACICCFLATTWTSIKCFMKPFLIALQARRTKLTLPLLFVSLISLSTMLFLSGYKKKWTVHAGESRQVVTSSLLTKSIQVQVKTLHSAVQIDVYDIPGKCPPLTGPKAHAEKDTTMKFNAGEYQYDYFFLNKGSQVQADLYQHQGTSHTYMLQGQDNLNTLQNPPSNQDWLDKLLDTATLSWTARDTDRHDTIAKFRSIKNDVYTLVYDNPFQNKGQLHVDLTLELATYNLQGYTPVCHDLALKECRPIPKASLFHKQCILVDASDSHGTITTDEVHLQIVEKRNYSFILVLSLAPLVLAILWEFWTCFKEKLQSCQRRQRGTTSDDEDEQPYEPPSLPSPIRRPPPTAPPAEQDDGSPIPIPVATAQVAHVVEEKEKKEKDTKASSKETPVNEED